MAEVSSLFGGDPEDPVVAGTYLSREQAEAALAHLQDRDVDQIEITQPATGVWQVRVPRRVAATTVRELEQLALRTTWR